MGTDGQDPAHPPVPIQTSPPAQAAPGTPAGPSGAGPSSQPGFGERLHELSDRVPPLGEALTNLASFIPGFAGYKETENRRIADQQLRAVIGERLTKIKSRLDGAVDALSRGGNLDGLALIDQSGRRLARLTDRMRFADYGYSAVFDHAQISEAELARLYQYDAGLMGDLGSFNDAVSQVEEAGADLARLSSALSKLDGLSEEFERRFDARKHLFDGLPTP